VEVIHSADVLVAYFSGDFDFVLEALDDPALGRDVGLDKLEGDLFVQLGVVNAIDAAHAPGAQFFDDFITGGKDSSSGELIRCSLQGFSEGDLIFLGSGEIFWA
jgi:hypothetical protein